jgi:hypothetical protein
VLWAALVISALIPFFDFFSLRAAQHLDKIKVSTIDD